MFHSFDGHHFLGMHPLWWVFWILIGAIAFGAYAAVRRKSGGKVG